MKKDRIIKTVLMLLIMAGCAALIVVADQITKNIIVAKIPYGSSVVLIPGLLEISHVHNTGAAWGVLSEHTAALSCVTVAACCLLAWIIYETRSRLFRACLVMVIGGAIGNLIDRVSRGFVVDFIRVWIGKYEFPNFNVADSFITVGCFMMIVTMLVASRKGAKPLFNEGSLLDRFFRGKPEGGNKKTDGSGEKPENGGAAEAAESARTAAAGKMREVNEIVAQAVSDTAAEKTVSDTAAEKAADGRTVEN